MALKDMLEALGEEGAGQCKEIISRAEAQKAAILEEAKKEAEETRQEEVKKVQTVIQVDRAKVINEARLAVKREVIHAKEELIQETFQEATKELQAFRKSPDYAKSFERMVDEAVEEIPGRVAVNVEKRDEKLAKEVLARKGIEYELVGSLNSSGGLRITSEDGRISLTNTFGIRLEKAKRLLKSDVMNILFG